MLKQDEPTRWNTTLHVIQYIIEQKTALAVYSTEHDLVQLSSHQLDLANKIVDALSPVEEITESILANAASVYAIILFICMLQRSLEKHHNDRGVQTMKHEMLKLLKQRCADAECNEIVTISTILDPRIKEKLFSCSGVVEELTSSLKHKVAELQARQSKD